VKNFTLRDFIGLVLIGSFIGVIGALFWRDIPKSNEQLLVYMIGQLSGFVAGVVSFHYVTKAGEKELEAQRVDNVTKTLDAIVGAQNSLPPDPDKAAGQAADAVANAAVDRASEIQEGS
jgi:hypothetical protein